MIVDGTIDTHCHVLPGLDDGAQTMEESLEFCRLAKRDGVAITVATPHVRPDFWPNTAGEIRKALAQMRLALEEAGIEHRLEMGGEVHIQAELPALARDGEIPTYADRGRHLLLELPDVFPEHKAEEAVEGLRGAGIVPVIAHPERCETLALRPELMYRLVRSGALGQVTGMSLDGTFGGRAKRAARVFLKCNLIHLVGSDAHSTARRRPVLSRAFGLIRSLGGEEMARRLAIENPLAVLRGRDVVTEEPVDPSEHGGFLSRLLRG